MAAPTGLEGKINSIASRPTDPNLDERLDQIRTAEAIHRGGHGDQLEAFINGLMADRGIEKTQVHRLRALMNLSIREAEERVMRHYNNIAYSGTMAELIRHLKTQLVRDERVADPRRHALVGAISSLQGLPGTTTSHPTDPTTGTRIAREAAGGPTALIAQMIGRNADGSDPRVREYRPPAPRAPAAPGDPDYGLYDGGRRRRTRRRYTRRR